MKRAFWATFVVGMLGAIGCAALQRNPVTADEAAGIIREGATVAECEAKGYEAREAGEPDAYGVYDNCMREGGLR